MSNEDNTPQNFEFDKFMQDIVTKESRNHTEDVKPEELTPQRQYIQKYRELPQNRTRWSR
jgi:hypothetical protein